MEERREALFEIVAAQRPMTVRQVFYATTVRGLVDKTELGYDKIQTTLTAMRRDGDSPYSWLANSTRRMRKSRSYNGAGEFIRRRQPVIARPCGRTQVPMSRSGLKRTRWPASSSMSPTNMTCR